MNEDQQLEKAAEMLKAIAHPTRISILQRLKDGKSHNVTALYTMLCCEQATISHHLGVLKNKGILISKRDGKNTYYSIKKDIFVECINKSIIATLLNDTIL